MAKLISIMLCGLLLITKSYAEVYSNKHYYNSNTVNDIAFEVDTIWLATKGGIVKLQNDGQILEVYNEKSTIAGNKVSVIHVDNNGIKWAVTPEGALYKLVENIWVTEFEAGTFPDVESITTDNENNLWISIGDYLRKYDGQTLTDYYDTFNNNTNHVEIDSGGNLWEATAKGVIAHYANGETVTYDVNNGLDDDYIKTLCIDKDDNIWVAMSYQGVAKFDGTNWTNFSLEDGLISTNLTDLTASTDGNIWLSTQAGISMYNGSKWVSFTEDDGLPRNAIINIASKDDGTVWAASFSHISVYDGNKWTSFDISGPAGTEVHSVLVDDNNTIWTGALEGVSYFNGNKWIKHDVNYSFLEVGYDLSHGLNGEIWIASDFYGGYQYKDGQWINYLTKDGLASNNVNCVVIDANGNAWFGTDDKGASLFDGTNWTTFTTTDGLPNDQILSIAIDNDENLWFGTHQGGTVKYDGTNWQAYLTPMSADSTSIFDIKFDRNGKGWYATNKGVMTFDGTVWTTITTDDGLASNMISCITIDSKGNVWAGTEGKGLSMYNGDKWITFDSELASLYVNDIAEDKESFIWVATRGGITRLNTYNPDADSDNDGVSDSEDFYPLDPTKWDNPDSPIEPQVEVPTQRTESNIEVTAFPIPARTELCIGLESLENNSYTITNINGTIVMTGILSENRINVKHLQNGTYLLTINDHKILFVKKI